MVFTIELDEPKNWYLAGDVVKGNVVLHSENDEAIGRVAITFFGLAKTKIYVREESGNKNYHSLCILFSYTKDLYIGKYTFKRGRYSWPFEFEFPMQTVPCSENNKFGSTDGPWPEANVPHPLPPTFTTAITGYMSSADCTVEYKLEAKLTRPPDAPFIKRFSSMESVLGLTYLPQRREQFPDPLPHTKDESFTVKTLRLLPERRHDRLSIKEILQSTFKSSELPSATFTVELVYPMQVYPGGPFPITLALKGMQTSEDVTADPTVAIKELMITVIAVVLCRGVGIATIKQANFSVDTVLVDTFGEINVELPRLNSNEAKAGTAPREVDLKQLGKTSFSTQKIECDFQTYNITLIHQLEVKAKLLCASKEFKLKVGTPLKVLSSAYRPIAVPRPAVAEPSSSQAAPANMANQAAISETGELPAYEPPPPQYELGDRDQMPEKATSSSSRAE